MNIGPFSTVQLLIPHIMKRPASFLTLLAGSLAFAATPARCADPLDLNERPSYADLIASGLKLLNPSPEEFASARPAAGAQSRGLTLEAEPADLTLAAHDSTSSSFHFTRIDVGFRGADLTPPGTYYPPAHPVQDETLISSLHLAGQVEIADLPEVAKSFAGVFGLDAAKLNPWIDNELWDSTPGLTLPGDVPGGRVEVNLSGPLGETKALLFSISVIWAPKDTAGQGQPQNRPAPVRRVPTPPNR